MAMDCEDEDELEALSLRDLPDSSTREDSARELPRPNQSPEDFDFGRCSRGSFTIQPEMCAAEDVFFRGQIIPLSRSRDWSGERGTAYSHRKFNLNSRTPCLSRSQSVDRSLQRKLIDVTRSSSSSEIRQGARYPNQQSQFRYFTVHGSQKKSAVWEFFRLGLIRNPEFRDLQFRTSVSSSGSNNAGIRSTRKVHDEDGSDTRAKKEFKTTDPIKRGIFSWRSKQLSSSCSCSGNAVKPSLLPHSKLQSFNDEKEREKKNTKISRRELSRRRTDEWIKQLPRASDIIHETS